tara:strand:+ start:390 stop:641 length:252 start_codon:yes stop_codon:yes gene_type:complete
MYETVLSTSAAATSLILALSAAAQADTVLLTADAMVDVEAGTLMQGPGVLIEDGKVVSVGQLVLSQLRATLWRIFRSLRMSAS